MRLRTGLALATAVVLGAGGASAAAAQAHAGAEPAVRHAPVVTATAVAGHHGEATDHSGDHRGWSATGSGTTGSTPIRPATAGVAAHQPVHRAGEVHHPDHQRCAGWGGDHHGNFGDD